MLPCISEIEMPDVESASSSSAASAETGSIFQFLFQSEVRHEKFG